MNSYHIFGRLPSGIPNDPEVPSSAILDGFVLTGGRADGSGAHIHGAGIYLWNCSPTIRNCTLEYNYSVSSGGALYSISKPRFNNCTFRYNRSNTGTGGAIHTFRDRVQNSNFYNNKGPSGGAISISNNATLLNSTFWNNHAFSGQGGSISVISGTPIIANCTFSANESAQCGGAIYGSLNSFSRLYNCIIWNNKSLFDEICGTIDSVKNCIVEGGYEDGIYIFEFYPEFVDSGAFDFRIEPCSEAIDLGINSYSSSNYDVVGANRTINNDIDLGAFEHQSPKQIVYVESAANGLNNGKNWDDAYFYLQDALTSESIGACSEIWVAQGTYYPDEGVGQSDNDKSSSFIIKKDIQIYGGFVGTETMRDMRNWDENKTTLSGDIDKNDMMGDTSSNAYNVVKSSGSPNLIELTRIDGVAIRSGYAYGGGLDEKQGAGANMDYGNPTFANCIFEHNIAESDGGGYFGRVAQFFKCTFRSNSAENGGGITTQGNSIIENCSFNKNRAILNGGALYTNFSSAQVDNCVFDENEALGVGGAVYNSTVGVSQFYNCLFYKNEAQGGNAVRNSSHNDSEFINCTFALNDSSGGTTFSSNGGSPKIYNSSFWNYDTEISHTGSESTTVINSIVRGGFAGGSSIMDIYPEFQDTSNHNFTLKLCSAAIDKGEDDYNSKDTDLANNLRKHDAGVPVVSDRIDIGAYEYQGSYSSNCCPVFLELSGTIVAGSYEASSYISCNGTVRSGNSVIFSAPDSVIMKQSFQVQSAGIYEVNNVGCNP